MLYFDGRARRLRSELEQNTASFQIRSLRVFLAGASDISLMHSHLVR